MFKKIGSGIIVIRLRFLYDSHCNLDKQCYNNHQCRDNKSVDHWTDTGFLHAGEGGVQANGCQCADHQEFTCALGAGYNCCRNGENACHDGHSQESQNEPGENLYDREISLQLFAILLISKCFLTLDIQLNEGESDDSRNYC